MFTNNACLILTVTLVLSAGQLYASDYRDSDFATTLQSASGYFGASPYDDPCAVFGKPTTLIKDGTKTFACSLVYPSFNTDPNGKKLVVTFDIGDVIIAGFDHQVGDDPCNLYGIDFIVFGNSKFAGNGWVNSSTDMDTYILKSPASVGSEPVTVSVAQYAQGPWYTFSQGPYADYLYPTNSRAWDSNTHNWSYELNWLKPLNPNLNLSAFSGLSAAAAIRLYNGSAGGTGYDLKWLASADYQALASDPNTGRKWIRYVKFTSNDFGEVDAVSDVASCGDYRHPYPTGDINHDCIVDYKDVLSLSEYWLADVITPADPAKSADVVNDNIVNLRDFAALAKNWHKCTWQNN